MMFTAVITTSVDLRCTISPRCTNCHGRRWGWPTGQYSAGGMGTRPCSHCCCWRWSRIRRCRTAGSRGVSPPKVHWHQRRLRLCASLRGSTSVRRAGGRARAQALPAQHTRPWTATGGAGWCEQARMGRAGAASAGLRVRRAHSPGLRVPAPQNLPSRGALQARGKTSQGSPCGFGRQVGRRSQVAALKRASPP
jgi:hypothetical protein